MGAIIQSPEKCFRICLFSVLAATPTQSLLLCFVTSCPSVTFRAIIASKCQLSKKWFERCKVLEGVWHRATTLQENNCHHQQSKMPSLTLFGNMTVKTGEILTNHQRVSEQKIQIIILILKRGHCPRENTQNKPKRRKWKLAVNTLLGLVATTHP